MKSKLYYFMCDLNLYYYRTIRKTKEFIKNLYNDIRWAKWYYTRNIRKYGQI
jgi:hypothetical protein